MGICQKTVNALPFPPSLLAAILSAVLLALAGCGGGDAAEDVPARVEPERALPPGSTVERLRDAQRPVVGIKFDQPGFGLRGPDGQVTGFDVEIAEIIADELGIPEEEISYVEATSGVREELLEQGQVDIVVATYTITDRRKERVDFAGPYYVAGQQLMVRADDDSISGPESSRGGDMRVCTVKGSTPAVNIRRYPRRRRRAARPGQLRLLRTTPRRRWPPTDGTSAR